LLKQITVLLAPVLVVMCNTSLTTGKLPSVEKHAIVSARLKKPTFHPTDLQPLIHTQTGRALRRILAARFVAHCEHNKLFPSRQSAHQHHHSTETAMLVDHSDIVQAVDIDPKAAKPPS